MHAFRPIIIMLTCIKISQILNHQLTFDCFTENTRCYVHTPTNYQIIYSQSLESEILRETWLLRQD